MIERVLQRFWTDVRHGNNIELYATLIIAFGLAILNLLGIASAELVGSLTLVVLGFLAVSMLASRHHLETALGSKEMFFLKRRSEFVPFEQRAQHASEIVIIGISLVILYHRRSYFETKLREGCTLRFLFLDPSCQAVKTFNAMAGHEGALRNIANALDTLEYLSKKDSSFPGKLEARIANVYLPFGVAAFDPKKRSGVMSVELHTYQGGLEDRAHFELSNDRNAEWFEFFRSQYEKLWNDSPEWFSGWRPAETAVGNDTA